MANRRGYNYNRIGGSTSVKSSSQSFVYSDYQDNTQHVPPHSSQFPQIIEESKVKHCNLERVEPTFNRGTVIDENTENSVELPQNFHKGSRIARQQLINSRINVKKVFIFNNASQQEIIDKLYCPS
jgi:hypothetical protein